MNFLLTKRLKYFITSMEAKCINLAAEQLYITRTPLIRILKELEMNFQGDLFHRKYNKLEPTELALAVYDKVKPIYDMLYTIEYEMMKPSISPSFELLFDISVPYIVFHYMEKKFQRIQLPVFCRRVSVSKCDIISLLKKKDTGLFFFKEIQVPDDIYFHPLGEQSLCMLLSENIKDNGLNNIEDVKSIHNVIVFIRRDEFSYDVKKFINSMVKDYLPYVVIKETEFDLSFMMLSVSAGDSALILPERIASYFTPPKTKKILIPGEKLKTGFYINKKYKNNVLVNNLIDILDL